MPANVSAKQARDKLSKIGARPYESRYNKEREEKLTHTLALKGSTSLV
jgi:hypothetical protein